MLFIFSALFVCFLVRVLLSIYANYNDVIYVYIEGQLNELLPRFMLGFRSNKCSVLTQDLGEGLDRA
jgi:hypothetical protein